MGGLLNFFKSFLNLNNPFDFLFSRIPSVSEMGKNLAGAAVIQPDASDGSAPEDPYS